VKQFDKVRDRLVRAEKHLRNAQAGIKKYCAGVPLNRVIEIEPVTERQIHKFQLGWGIPAGVKGDAADFMESARAVLDGCGFAAAEVAGNAQARKCQFPIADGADRLETDVIRRGNCRDIPTEIVDHFRALQPYRGGNDLIWLLNKYANESKHRLLTPIGMSSSDAFARTFSATSVDIYELPPRWDEQRNALVLCILPKGATATYSIDVRVVVRLRNIEEGFVPNQRVSMQAIYDCVADVAKSTEEAVAEWARSRS